MYEFLFQDIINKINEITIENLDEKKQILIEELKQYQNREIRNQNFFQEAFDLVNFSGNGKELAEHFIENLYKQHRTLQQSFFRVIAMIIEGFAKEKNFDARNKGSLEWANKVSKVDWYMPLI